MKNQKRTYDRASLTVLVLRGQDVITTSPLWGGESDDVIKLPEDIF